MYLVDFFKRMFRKSNIPVLIYLILNILFISLITISMLAAMEMDGALTIFLGLFLAIGVYAVSLAIALSPIGEAVLRLQTGCKKIKKKKYKDFIYPIFEEVYQRARELDPSIPDNVQLFMTNDKSVNAFATGRKTVCVTKGMMEKPADQIKAALAHEFGHLAHKDTDLILLITIGNLFVTIIVTIVKLTILMFQLMLFIFSRSEEGLIGLLFTFISLISVDLMMWIWTKIGTLLVMKSSRSKEYEADEFAFRLGYGTSLLHLFETFGHSGAKGLFATLESSHPDTEDRIARIEDLMNLAQRGELPAYNVSGQATVITEDTSSDYANTPADGGEYYNSYPQQGMPTEGAPSYAQSYGQGAPGYTQSAQAAAFADAPVNRTVPVQDTEESPVTFRRPANRSIVIEDAENNSVAFARKVVRTISIEDAEGRSATFDREIPGVGPIGEPATNTPPVTQAPPVTQTPSVTQTPPVTQTQPQTRTEEPVRMRPASNVQVCSSCGSELEENAKFCGMCGTRVENQPKRVFCINCGEPELDADAAFCVYCGAKLLRN